jgi:hypothetical protein
MYSNSKSEDEDLNPFRVREKSEFEKLEELKQQTYTSKYGYIGIVPTESDVADEFYSANDWGSK